MIKEINPNFNEAVYNTLTEENQCKVECIYHIAHMLHVNQVPKLNGTDFDLLYDKPVRELVAIVDNVQDLIRWNKKLYL